MNPYANEIIFVGKKNGSTAVGMLGWLTMPNSYLENKVPYDLLHDEHSNVEKEFDRVLNALNESHRKRTGENLEYQSHSERHGLNRFMNV